MASSNPGSSTAASIALSASDADKKQFQALWQDHLDLRDQYKIVYYLPGNLGAQMGAHALEEIADRLSQLVATPVSIYFDIERSSYRIGQVLDQHDRDSVGKCFFVYETQHQTGDQSAWSDSISPGWSSSSSTTHQSPQGFNLVEDNENPILSTEPLQKIPKPRNKWIIYRQNKHNLVSAKNPGLHTSKISTIISTMWRNESPEVKAQYHKLAEEEKCKHRIKFPGYKCSPRKSSEIKRRQAHSKVTAIEINGQIPVDQWSPGNIMDQCRAEWFENTAQTQSLTLESQPASTTVVLPGGFVQAVASIPTETLYPDLEDPLLNAPWKGVEEDCEADHYDDSERTLHFQLNPASCNFDMGNYPTTSA